MKHKRKLLAMSLIAIMSACTLPDTSISDRDARDELSALLNTVPAVQPVARRPVVEEVRIPRHAPWLGQTIDAQYQDEAKEAIRTVLQGRPVVFDLKNDSSPLVSSPVGASTVLEHLDAIAVQADWAYTIEGGVVIVSDSVTRQFALQAIPGVGVGRVSLDTLDAGSGGASNSLDVLNAPYRDLEGALRSVFADYKPGQAGTLGGDSQMYSLVPAGNSLTVNGPPSLLRRVAQVVDDFNESLNRKVHLIITVYDVSFTNSSQRSIDFDLLRDAAIISNASFQGSSLIQTTTGSFSLGLDFFEGNSMDASTVVFNLLRQQGNTSVKLHEAFEATNNVVFSIEDQRRTPYISQVSLQRQDGGSISSLTPSIETETISTGLGFHVVATIANQNINVRLSLSQSDLVRFEPYRFGSGDAGISGTLPVTDTQDRVIPMTLKDGETRLIANLTQSQFRNDSAGSGLGLLGRSSAADNSEKQTVIAVTAKIL